MTTVITGEGIAKFRITQVMHGLALEINTGMRLSNRGSVMNVARDMCGSAKRTKKGVLADYIAWVEREHPDITVSDTIRQALRK